MFFWIPQTIAIVTAALVGTIALRHRSEPGAKPYALITLAQIGWMMGYLLEIASPGLLGKIFWDNFEFVCCSAWALAIVAFGAEYGGTHPPLRRLLYGAYAIPMLAFCVLTYTDPWHHLVRGNVHLVQDGLRPALIYDFGVAAWWFAVCTGAMYATCIVLILRKWVIQKALYRTQTVLVLIGNLIPFVGVLTTATVLRDSPERDISPYTIVISNLLIALGLFRYRLLDIAPLARDTVIEHLGDAVIVLDEKDRVVDYNPTARTYFALSGNPAVGVPVGEAFPVLAEIRESLAESGGRALERVFDSGGSERHVNVLISPVSDRTGRSLGRALVLRDITDAKLAERELRRHRDNLEQRVQERSAELLAANEQLRDEIDRRSRLQEQFLQAQKMEAVGRLAGGVAHDFNNLLTGILGHAELIREDLPKNSPAIESLDAVFSAASQAAALTRQLLTFSRKQIVQPQPVNLSGLLGQMEKLLRRVLGEDVELAIESTSDLGCVKADPVQLQQVVMNLAVNARDAMPEGGRLSMAAENATLAESRTMGPVTLPPGRYVVLAVSDTGAGIAPETMTHIFEPFFTTKAIGKGTGLGLATVLGIVEQSGGAIHVESELGKGTTFWVYLPRIEKEGVAPHALLTGKEGAAARGGESILLVEDESTVRTLSQRVLRQAGYRVTAAVNAREALQLLRDTATKFDLLLTDVIMPAGITAQGLADELAAMQPLSRVLFMSGYAEDVIAHHGVLDPGIAFLAKPFERKELLRKVREVLDSTKP